MTHRKIALPILGVWRDFIPNNEVVCSGVDFITSLTEVIEKKKMRIRIGNRYYNL